jgi:hypothetical protein
LSFVNSLVNELKAHQLVLIFLCAAIGTLAAFVFFTTVQSLCFGLITGVFTYSFLLSREERESNIKFSDFEQPVPTTGVVEEQRHNKAASELASPVPVQPVFPGGRSAFPEVAAKALPEAEPTAPPEAEAGTAASAATKAVAYRRSLANCWKCNDQMYLYTWDGHQPWQTEAPPAPVPDALQLRWSNPLAGKYWANVCLKCGSAQADDIIFDERRSLIWEEF